MVALAPVPAADESQNWEQSVAGMDAAAVGREFLQATSDLWFLLSGIRDKEDADRAAAPFSDLVRRIFALDDRFSQLSTVDMLPELQEGDCAGQLDKIQVQILDSFENLNGEFNGLCRVRCYGSKALTAAFQEAVSSGMFTEDDMVLLQDIKPPMNEEETAAELCRLKNLEAPDRAVLDVLEHVTDPGSASKAVPELTTLSRRLMELQPEPSLSNRSFAESSSVSESAAYAPIEPLLWGIRNELVRIAALPGYETEPYDDFSAALESVFEGLGRTHCACFDNVFDACFRDDMDEAVQSKFSSDK